MDHAGPDPVGPFRRFLMSPDSGWLVMGVLMAVSAWAMGRWADGGDPLLLLCLGAMLGMGASHTQVYAFHDDELTLRLRIWDGLFHAIWLAGFLGLLDMTQPPADFAFSAVVGGGIFGAMMAAIAKPYSADRFAFLELEDTTIFQRGGRHAWLAALWPVLIIAGSGAELYYRKSVPYAIFFIAGALNLAPQYRMTKRDSGKGPALALLGEARFLVLLALVIPVALRLHGTI